MRHNGTTHIAPGTGIGISNPAAPRLTGRPGSRRGTPANRTLKMLRINLGYSPRQLGEVCDPPVNGKTISRAEKGAIPHPITQVTIVDALNKLRALRDPNCELLDATDVFPTERVPV